MVFLVLVFVPCIVCAADGVQINSTAFPDETFRNNIKWDFEKNSDSVPSSSEISNAKSINYSDKKIESLAGIEYLTALQVLDCSNNSLTSLDVSKNTALVSINCSGNQLTGLDVSKNTALKILDCGNNELGDLDIIKNTALWYFKCGFCGLSKLDISNNTLLNFLVCYGNSISTLDIRNCSLLKEAYTGGVDYEDAADGVRFAAYESDDKNYRLLVNKTTTVIYMDYGWAKENGNWYFYKDGLAQTGWQKISGKWYYFNNAGVMQTGWQKISNAWYFLNAGGDMATGWKKVSGKWYYFNASGAMQTGWQKVDDKTYFFKSSGAMAANEWCQGWWLNANGTWTYPYKASWKQDSTGWWYEDTSGWYARNCTITIDSKEYTFDSRGYWVQ